MLDYAVKLTREPHAIGASDVVALRRTGFDGTAVDLTVSRDGFEPKLERRRSVRDAP